MNIYLIRNIIQNKDVGTRITHLCVIYMGGSVHATYGQRGFTSISVVRGQTGCGWRRDFTDDEIR
ncbi:ErfK/YbiS/YcfS/YnhG family protein [Paenibacillus amylolyticus]|uniref:ErfK/YbiS/YcfS/YnhG family protein n=1 Tax=Paenibacillus amylolyticus TaxID=1451 RepID=A0A100VLU1_PAEAM|nr:ErfK/YbiS/YcfS/YnhG family protein [Paenibacillus amylolyticus]